VVERARDGRREGLAFKVVDATRLAVGPKGDRANPRQLRQREDDRGLREEVFGGIIAKIDGRDSV
jgi:hypothetical protein